MESEETTTFGEAHAPYGGKEHMGLTGADREAIEERVMLRTYEVTLMTKGAGNPDYVLMEALDADPTILDWKFSYKKSMGGGTNVVEWSK